MLRKWKLIPPYISEPNGTGDTVVVGDLYNITYSLDDPDDAVTAAFYYDTDSSGLDGGLDER